MKTTLEKITNRVRFRMKVQGPMPDRFYDELDYIKEAGMVGELLFFSDMVRFLKSEGVNVASGRGLMTGSLVCYGLGLTDVNPLEWNLGAESFMTAFENEENRQYEFVTGNGGFSKAVEYVTALNQLPFDVAEDNVIKGVMFNEDYGDFRFNVKVCELEVLDGLKEFESMGHKDPMMVKLDKRILEVFTNANTDEVWSFGSARMKDILLVLQPECFSDLYLAYVLGSPGYEWAVDKIVSRKIEKTVPSAGIPEIDGLLMESYGVVVYQEQLDRLRKILSQRGEADFDPDLCRNIMQGEGSRLMLKGDAIANTMISVASAYVWLVKSGGTIVYAV